MTTLHSITRFLASHRETLLFLPIVLGLLFWTAAVALADEKELQSPEAEMRRTSLPIMNVARPMIAYDGTYEKYGFRNRSKVLSAPFFNPAALDRIAIANAYRSSEFVSVFNDICAAMVEGKIALVREAESGKFEVVDVGRHAAEHSSDELKRLLSEDDSYLVTSAASISDRQPDFRLVSWDAERPLHSTDDFPAPLSLCGKGPEGPH